MAKQSFLTGLDNSLAFQSHLAESLNVLDPNVGKGRFRVEAISTNVKRIGMARELEEAIDRINDSEAWRLPGLERNQDTRTERANSLRATMKSRVLLEELKELMDDVTASVKGLHMELRTTGRKRGITIPPIPGFDIDGDVEMAEEPGDFSEAPIPQYNSSSGPIGNTHEMDSVLNGLEDTLSVLKDRVKDVEASLSQRQEEISDEVQGSLDSQFAELMDAVEGPPKILLRATSLSEANAQRLNMVEGEIGKAGEEIGELAQEVASVITQSHEVTVRNGKLEGDNKWLKEENNRLREELKQVKQAQAEELARMRADTDELKNQFNAYIQTQAEPPKPPSVEDIISLLLPRVHESLQPQIEEKHGSLQNQITSEVKTCNEDLTKKMEILTGEVKFFEKWADAIQKDVDPVHMLERFRANAITSTSISTAVSAPDATGQSPVAGPSTAPEVAPVIKEDVA